MSTAFADEWAWQKHLVGVCITIIIIIVSRHPVYAQGLVLGALSLGNVSTLKTALGGKQS